MTKETYQSTRDLSIKDIVLFAYKYVINLNKSSAIVMIFFQIFNKKQQNEKTSQLLKSVTLHSK